MQSGTVGWIVVATLVTLITLAAAAEDSDERRLSSSSLDAQLSFNFARSIAVGASADVHVVWFDDRIRYRRSLDDGLTFEAEVPLSSDTTVSQHPAVATAGQTVYAAWHELPGGVPQIVFRRSPDRGATWEAAQRLTDPAIPGAHPSVAATDTRVHVTWFDSRHGLTEIYTRRSLDQGRTWEPEQRISQSDAESWVATVESSGSDVYIAWVDYIDGNEEEYLRRSTDGGASWHPPARLTEDAADSWAPSIAVAGSTVHFAWFDRRDAGVTDREVEAKLNEALVLVGLPVSSPPPRDPKNYYLHAFIKRIQDKMRQLMGAAPQWVAAGGDRHRLEEILRDFEDAMARWSFGWEIYDKKSTDRGASFSPDRRLTVAPGASQRPSLAVWGDQVSVVWFDTRDENEPEIYAKFSRDGGLTWGPDLRLTDARGESSLASAARSPETLHVVWVDARRGNKGIYYERISTAARQRPIRIR